MAEGAIKINEQKGEFREKVKSLLPDSGNLNICLTCGTCSAGCPATGLEGMDPRKFVRMVALGMDEEPMPNLIAKRILFIKILLLW